MAHTGVVVNSISCPPCLGVLCVYFLTSSRTGWGSDGTFQGFEMVDQSRKRCLFYKEHGQAPHFMCAMTFSFCSSLFCLWLLFLCNSAQMLLCLCVSLAAWIPPPLSRSLALHPWLHSIHPWGPIDRLQQPFNEISPLLLEKRNAAQSNANSLPPFLLMAPSPPFYIYCLLNALFWA